LRQQLSLMVLQALQQVQTVQGRLLHATIDQQQLSMENLSLRRRLEQRLKSIAPGATVLAERVVPERGAARFAMREAGVRA